MCLLSLSSILATGGVILNVHIQLPELDVWKKIRFDPTMKVKDAIHLIIEKANVQEVGPRSFILLAPDFQANFSGEGCQLVDEDLMSNYGLQMGETLQFKLKPHPMAKRIGSVTVVNLEGRVETVQIDFNEHVDINLDLPLGISTS